MAFVTEASGSSSVAQSVLAIVGTVGLQSSSTKDVDTVVERMRERIDQIFGDNLSKDSDTLQTTSTTLEDKMAATVDMQTAIKKKLEEDIMLEAALAAYKPVEVRYQIPAALLPDPGDPRPTIVCQAGDRVRLMPVVAFFGAGKQFSDGEFDELTTGDADDTHVKMLMEVHSKAAGNIAALQSSKPETLKWSIHPPLSVTTGLSFDPSTGVIRGTIPTPCPNHDRQTYTVLCSSEAGSCRTRVTFQIHESE